MQKCINLFLSVIKLPVALLMVVLIIPALKTDAVILYNGLTLTVLQWFFVPLLAVLCLWMLIPGLGGSFLSIFEHEATHMVFALLTGHTPQDINIKRGVGGNFIYRGQGNWLIYIAPYFFPTSALLVIGAAGFYVWMGQTTPPAYLMILGIMTGYHLISTFDEIHPGQTDFAAAGYLFSLLFLPGANLLMYGLLMAYACYGFHGFSMFYDTLIEQSRWFIGLFFFS